MKAVLIDPYSQTVTNVEYSGDYKQIYEFIDASLFDLVRIGDEGEDGDLFVDDEGLLKAGPETMYFSIFNSHALAGRGLVLGSNGDGESADAPHDADWYAQRVRFMSPLAARVYMELNFR